MLHLLQINMTPLAGASIQTCGGVIRQQRRSHGFQNENLPKFGAKESSLSGGVFQRKVVRAPRHVCVFFKEGHWRLVSEASN